ncbi:MAG: RsmB/NOP family class I SAM-dependent RNA methyltransferase, partial [Pseudomonadota bacterium]
SARDKALAWMIAVTALRRQGQIDRILKSCLQKPLSGRALSVRGVLAIGAAQILFMDVSDHAAVDLSVRLCRQDRKKNAYANLVNGVLRRVTRERGVLLGATAPADNIPPTLRGRWAQNYGDADLTAFADLISIEPPLDITLKNDDEGSDWAAKLGGVLLPNGSVRIARAGDVSRLEGYDDGAWWVQDAAASISATLFRGVDGKTVADLCAAPGGKTAQLAARGAKVYAVESSSDRMARLKSNFRRLNLTAETIIADAAQWTPPQPLDAVLLDAPCSATGTLRRNPDFSFLRGGFDPNRLLAVQARLIDQSTRMLRPGGELVYCTCSLEPEEGENQVQAALERHNDLAINPVQPSEVPGFESAIREDGTLRILPTALPNQDPRLAGATGFFIARLTKRA